MIYKQEKVLIRRSLMEVVLFFLGAAFVCFVFPQFVITDNKELIKRLSEPATILSGLIMLFGFFCSFLLGRESMLSKLLSNPQKMEKFLAGFIHHYSPDCAFLTVKQSECGHAPLVHKFIMRHEAFEPDTLPTFPALIGTCRQIIKQIEEAQKRALEELKPLEIITKAAEKVAQAQSDVTKSLTAAEEEKARIQELITLLKKGQVPFSALDAAEPQLDEVLQPSGDSTEPEKSSETPEAES